MVELYLEHEYGVAVFQLVCAMLGMGATLTLADFGRLLQQPKAVGVGLALQLLMVPLLTFAFIWGLSPSAGVAIGIAVIAAIPGGTTSNIFTLLARGNIALSIAITVITTLICLATTPLVLQWLAASHMPLAFTMPTAQIMREILLTLLLPLALGMACFHFFPKIAPGLSRWSIRASLLGLAAIVLGSALAGRLDINAFGMANVGLVVLYTLLLWAMAAVITLLLRLPQADGTAIQLEVLVRNINLGILLKTLLFPASLASMLGDQVLFTLLLFGALQMLGAAVVIVWQRQRHPATTAERS
ncbi:bile acid:sodium symporter family protein [Ferrimonas marina]|uniref:Bile acid:Na+ symporter, BASS family n=1 Tax=Ferrimonas marina TaxID=299255 RepID=A0A1M5MYS2_9GAMM|nr:bile acid:sodium symporter [Ferrimonas marina]SHG81893.1 bile acid:Na+ symporter, BASS family [Ferrimonas marina]